MSLGKAQRLWFRCQELWRGWAWRLRNSSNTQQQAPLTAKASPAEEDAEIKASGCCPGVPRSPSEPGWFRVTQVQEDRKVHETQKLPQTQGGGSEF